MLALADGADLIDAGTRERAGGSGVGDMRVGDELPGRHGPPRAARSPADTPRTRPRGPPRRARARTPSRHGPPAHGRRRVRARGRPGATGASPAWEHGPVRPPLVRVAEPPPRRRDALAPRLGGGEGAAVWELVDRRIGQDTARRRGARVGPPPDANGGRDARAGGRSAPFGVAAGCRSGGASGAAGRHSRQTSGAFSPETPWQSVAWSIQPASTTTSRLLCVIGTGSRNSAMTSVPPGVV